MGRKNIQLEKAIIRAGQLIEKWGYLVSYCWTLKNVFDINAESVYPPEKDKGIYAKVGIETITMDEYEAVLNFSTWKKKEIFILKKKGTKNDPGVFLIYRIEDKKIIEQPKKWPIEKALSSLPKQGIKSPKKRS